MKKSLLIILLCSVGGNIFADIKLNENKIVSHYVNKNQDGSNKVYIFKKPVTLTLKKGAHKDVIVNFDNKGGILEMGYTKIGEEPESAIFPILQNYNGATIRTLGNQDFPKEIKIPEEISKNINKKLSLDFSNSANLKTVRIADRAYFNDIILGDETNLQMYENNADDTLDLSLIFNSLKANELWTLGQDKMLIIPSKLDGIKVTKFTLRGDLYIRSEAQNDIGIFKSNIIPSSDVDNKNFTVDILSSINLQSPKIGLSGFKLNKLTLGKVDNTDKVIFNMPDTHRHYIDTLTVNSNTLTLDRDYTNNGNIEFTGENKLLDLSKSDGRTLTANKITFSGDDNEINISNKSKIIGDMIYKDLTINIPGSVNEKEILLIENYNNNNDINNLKIAQNNEYVSYSPSFANTTDKITLEGEADYDLIIEDLSKESSKIANTIMSLFSSDPNKQDDTLYKVAVALGDNENSSNLDKKIYKIFPRNSLYGLAMQLLINNNSYIYNSNLYETRNASSYHIWAKGLTGFGKDTSQMECDNDIYGGIIGIDKMVNNILKLGASMSYQKNKITYTNLEEKDTVNHYLFSLYSTYQFHQKIKSIINLTYMYSKIDDLENDSENTQEDLTFSHNLNGLLMFEYNASHRDYQIYPSLGIKLIRHNDPELKSLLGPLKAEKQTSNIANLVGGISLYGKNLDIKNITIKPKLHFFSYYRIYDNYDKKVLNLKNSLTPYTDIKDKLHNNLGINLTIESPQLIEYNIALNHNFSNHSNSYQFALKAKMKV